MVHVEGLQATAGREPRQDRARVPAAPEGAVDVEAVWADNQVLDRLLKQDRNVAAVTTSLLDLCCVLRPHAMQRIDLLRPFDDLCILLLLAEALPRIAQKHFASCDVSLQALELGDLLQSPLWQMLTVVLLLVREQSGAFGAEAPQPPRPEAADHRSDARRTAERQARRHARSPGLRGRGLAGRGAKRRRRGLEDELPRVS
mmetsp:Transcript_34986/g.100524  ORF Transcript_34986/g.100524 Transcript_34986/m.100524 type:complete len:201 (-) Transcript_34986:565-1167(-)